MKFLLFAIILLAGPLGSQAQPYRSVYRQYGQYQVRSKIATANKNLDSLIGLLEHTPLQSFDKTKHIPQEIKTFHKQVTGQRLRMANKGARWNSGCCQGGRLPGMLLQYLGVSRELVLICYDEGGFAIGRQVMIYRLEGGEIIDFWEGSVRRSNDVPDLAEILQLLRGFKR